jgi:hypothetical protein
MPIYLYNPFFPSAPSAKPINGPLVIAVMGTAEGKSTVCHPLSVSFMKSADDSSDP